MAEQVLSVKDLDFSRYQIMVHDGKGMKDRVAVLPDSVVPVLEDHLEGVRRLYTKDVNRGRGFVSLPFALERKYPNASKEWLWQYVFPSKQLSVDPRTGEVRRHHLHPSGPQKAIRVAAQATRIQKRVTCHTLRHCFATHLLEDGYDIRTVQKLLGHKQLKTTMIYTYVLEQGDLGVRSPLDRPHRARCEPSACPLGRRPCPATSEGARLERLATSSVIISTYLALLA